MNTYLSDWRRMKVASIAIYLYESANMLTRRTCHGSLHNLASLDSHGERCRGPTQNSAAFLRLCLNAHYAAKAYNARSLVLALTRIER